MRMFWLIIGVLAIVAAVLWWTSERAPSGVGRADPAPDLASIAGGTATNTEPAASMPTITPTTKPDDVVVQTKDTAKQATTPDGSDDEARALADDLADASVDAGGDELDAVLKEGGGAESGAASASVGKIDGKYILAGDGSPEQPFEITWDMLLLASQTYRPREGKTEIPAALEAVNGKHIKITGYFAVPLATTDSHEVLFMLNMWDGCCIGVPPSPYDAIEVRLKDSLGGKKQFINYGTLSGTLKVDPYVQNGWLLGMYLMEDGSLEIGM